MNILQVTVTITYDIIITANSYPNICSANFVFLGIRRNKDQQVRQ